MNYGILLIVLISIITIFDILTHLYFKNGVLNIKKYQIKIYWSQLIFPLILVIIAIIITLLSIIYSPFSIVTALFIAPIWHYEYTQFREKGIEKIYDINELKTITTGVGVKYAINNGNISVNPNISGNMNDNKPKNKN